MFALRPYWMLARPFTLAPPVVSIVSAALISHSASGNPLQWNQLVIAACAMALLNAASNGLNQVCDLDIDRINKPLRPLPSGALKPVQAWTFTLASYALALAGIATVNRETLTLYAVAAIGSVAYSVPPLRLKRHMAASNFSIALVRGQVLRLAGWSIVSSVLISIEPWYLGFLYFVFLLGAASTKDFCDIEGDRQGGCATLPVRWGARWTARAISPAFLLPWLLLALGAAARILTGNAVALLLVSVVMLAWGAYVAYLMNRAPELLVSEGENHPSWRHMYWMMMAGDVGLAAAYLVR